jgi:hypothetical protein
MPGGLIDAKQAGQKREKEQEFACLLLLLFEGQK